MNTQIENDIRLAMESGLIACTSDATALARIHTGRQLVKHLFDKLSDTVELNAYSGIFWFSVYNREDLQLLMTLSPQWLKTKGEAVITYGATVEGVCFELRAHDAALPSTCKLVEESYVVPAVAEHIATRMVVKCTEPNTTP